MKGKPAVMAVLQAGITAEWSLALSYHMFTQDMKRFGVKVYDGFDKLGEQCEDYAKELTRRLLFLEGDPVVNPADASTLDSVSAMLAKLQADELSIVDQYAAATKACWDAGDMSNFHWFQHLSKWHREGDEGKQGHIAWIQKMLWQIQAVGSEPEFIATQI